MTDAPTLSPADAARSWTPPADWTRIGTVDAHAAGEPLRVVVDGLPPISGDTILERRRHAGEHLDHLRTALMLEPRGHADMYGCILVPPDRPGSDFGVLFTHNDGYSTMCGHGVIAVTTVVLETGILPARAPETRLAIDTPAGRVEARAAVDGGRVQSVRFRNVASFVVARSETVEVAGLGAVAYDLAWGGAFYAYVDARALGLELAPASADRLIDAGRRIKRAVESSRPVKHPVEEELDGLYGTIFVGAPRGDGADARNVCVFADGELDRSPTGTGVSGGLALRHDRGEVEPGRPVVIESIVGSRFTGRIVETTEVAGLPAVVPEVEGRAHITGRHEFLLDPDDPFRHGFLVR